MQETCLHFTQSAGIFPTCARTIVPTPAGSMFPHLYKVNAKLLLKVKFKCLICTWLSSFISYLSWTTLLAIILLYIAKK